MNADIKAKWLEALRSGKYKQTRGRLRSTAGGMCCLGVLCDVVKPEGWASESSRLADDHRGRVKAIAHGMDVTMPREDLLHSIELDTKFAHALAVKNDGARWSFARIADYIEENL